MRERTPVTPVEWPEFLLVHIQTSVARVTKCSREMFASKLFWMYRQSNSTPRAPTHRKTNLERVRGSESRRLASQGIESSQQLKLF